MSKRAQFLNNLSLLASIYDHRSHLLLKKAEGETAQPLPIDLDSFFNSTSMYALKEYCLDHGVNNQNMIDWLVANQTVLRQYHIPWDNTGESLIGSQPGSNGYIQYQISAKLLKTDRWEPVAFLMGIGNMPPMKVYKEKTKGYGIPLEYFTKEIGHYGFLVTVLHKLLEFSGEELPYVTKQFIDQNSEKLAKIRSQLQTEPRELGAGIDGLAFSIGPHRVLKFFKSKYAYDSAMNAVHRLFKTPESAGTEAMIYDYGELPVYGNIQIYYYIIEKMAPLDKVMNNSLLSDLLNVIMSNAYSKSQLNIWKDKLQDPKNINLVSQEIKIRAKMVEDKIRSSQSSVIERLEKEIPNVENKAAEFFPQDVAKLEAAGKSFKINHNWLYKLIEEMLWKYATGRNDLHGGNIGVTSFGDFRFFDPAYLEPGRW